MFLSKVKNVFNKNSYIDIYADLKNLSYGKAKKELNHITEKYGISAQKFLNDKLWAYDDLDERIAENKKFDKAKQDSFKNYANKADESEAKNAKKKAPAKSDDNGDASRVDQLVKKYPYLKAKLSLKVYIEKKLFEKSDEEIIAFFKAQDEKRNQDYARIMAETGWSRYKLTKDIKMARILHGQSPVNYMIMEAWKKSHMELCSYARAFDSKYVTKTYNKKSGLPILRQKDRFAKEFSPFLKRKFWLNEEGASYESFLEFIDGLDLIFCKPVNLFGGRGTEKYVLADEDPKALYDYFMSKPKYICEECIKQHDDLNKIYDGSINTLRIVAIRHEGQVKILDVLMRFGNGGIVDNFSEGGMAVHVNKETGVIDSDAFDEAANSYEKHPISGIKFKGYQVPLWDKVLKLVEDATSYRDDVGFAGWDVAISNEDAMIVEGNNSPGFGLSQMPYISKGEGRRFLFTDYIDPVLYKAELEISERLDKKEKRGRK
ncbi:MAG: hypothetical protein MJ145_03020 [Clostridia bacterium]|nr:hypothetical protein [Clostridia bacterium]